MKNVFRSILLWLILKRAFFIPLIHISALPFTDYKPLRLKAHPKPLTKVL